MMIKIISFCVVIAILGILLILLIVLRPPFPSPDSLVEKDYGWLLNEFGDPAEVMPGKYVMWSRHGLIGDWVLLAGYEFPPDPVSLPVSVERYFRIGPKGRSVNLLRRIEKNAKTIEKPGV